jgi:hypothetical protein
VRGAALAGTAELARYARACGTGTAATSVNSGRAGNAAHLADGHHIQYLKDADYVLEQRAVVEYHLQQ